MKIINRLMIISLTTQILFATPSNTFQLDAGSKQTVFAGEIIDLNGKVTSGDKNNIDHYKWEENNEVLRNTAGDEIMYWDESQALNGYIPKEGQHTLNYIVVDNFGNEYTDELNINVQTRTASTFTLDAGSEQFISSGDIIDLNGKVTSGDKNTIDHYKWEENGKVLKNTAGDEIMYWDESHALNGHIVSGKGMHILKFIVVDISGKEHVQRLIVNVGTQDKVTIVEEDLTFDISSDFPIKREQRSQENYRLSRGHYLDVKVGDVIPLSGVIDVSKKYLVSSYHWELDGKILKNKLNEDILYWDENNRVHNYVLTQSGKEFLEFVVTDINGEQTKKTLLLKIIDESGNDDHGNTMDTATEISLNKVISGKHETNNDNDFFKFTLDKKQYIQVVMEQHGPRKVSVLSEDGEKIELKYVSVPASGGMYRIYQTLFNTGTYYVNVNRTLGDYTLEIKAEDVVEDKYGDSKSNATNINLDSKTVGYINSYDDIDYFSFVAPKTGKLTLEYDTERSDFLKIDFSERSERINNNTVSIDIKKGKKYYFSLSKSSYRGSDSRQQMKYTLSFSIK